MKRMTQKRMTTVVVVKIEKTSTKTVNANVTMGETIENQCCHKCKGK